MNNYELPVLTILKRLFLGFAGLVLISACLYWTIPSNAGLGFFFMVQAFSTLIPVLGVIALGVALWSEWLPRRPWWAAAGVLAWALAPIIAGPIFAFGLVDRLEAFYASPYYDTWYDAWSGITIAPQGQSFHYADCSLDAYTATYRITALRDTELGFALLDRNGLRAVDAGQGVAESIGQQLTFVREAPYFLVKGDGELGVFRVPAGAHTLVVQAQGPFQLGIMDPDPLWAPDLWLANETRPYAIYADDHTWEEIAAATAQYRPAACPPPCTRLDVPPPIENRDRVPVEKSATLRGVTGETPVDVDGDGYYDTLDLAVALNIRTTGDYLLEGSLYAAGIPDPVRARYHSGYTEPLCSGVHTATLHFEGKALHDIGADGPYTLTLALTHEEPGVAWPPPTDTASNAYTTAPYTRWQFAGEPHTPTAAADRVEELTGNGLYDQLSIEVTFHGLRRGPYRWAGELVGKSGCHAGAAEDQGLLDKETAAAFAFPGGRIRSSGCDGPYTLTDVTVVSLESGARTEQFTDLHTTPAYHAEEFDTTPIAVGRCEHRQPSWDNDDLYDRLIITASVLALDLPPDDLYEWRGSLLGPNGAVIDRAGGGGRFQPVATISFTFSAAAIRKAGIDGPYTLGDVTIASRTTPTVTVMLPALCTTDALTARFFEP